MKELNEKYAQIVQNRLEENLISGRKAQEYMENSTAIYRGEPVACLYMPKVFSQEAWEFLQKAAADICEILDKVTARYLIDAEYRKLFGFEKELEELILADAGYSRLLPIARLDIFFDENDFSFKFCEFNADGASAMNEDREINTAIANSDAMQQFSQEYNVRRFEFFDSWVQEFLNNYAEFSSGKKLSGSPYAKDSLADSGVLDGVGGTSNDSCPRVAIADFMDNATPNEFIEFQKAFRKAGVECEIVEIRDFKYVDGHLQTPDGKKIDAIYRRAVTCDIMARKSDVQPFLQATRDGAVCVIGHFRTQVIHNKITYKILRMPETLAFLTPYEREYVLRHIPETYSLVSNKFVAKCDVLQNKNDWVIKPEDLYGSRGVYVGEDCTDEEWAEAVENATDTGYLLQRFCPPYKSLNLDFSEKIGNTAECNVAECNANKNDENVDSGKASHNTEARPNFKIYNNITGLFVYNGKLQGIYSRAGLAASISPFKRGLTLASVVAQPLA